MNTIPDEASLGFFETSKYVLIGIIARDLADVYGCDNDPREHAIIELAASIGRHDLVEWFDEDEDNHRLARTHSVNVHEDGHFFIQ